MLYKNLKILLLVLFTSCTMNSLDSKVEQQINIRIWKNNTANFLEDAATSTGELRLDIANENAIEFDMKRIGDKVYVTYITDKETYTAFRPTGGWTGSSIPVELTNGAGDLPATMVKYSRIRTSSQEIFIGYDNNGAEIIRSHSLHRAVGNWIRVFEGVNQPTQDVKWELKLATTTPMVVSDPTILPLSSCKSTIVMISNQRQVMVINDTNKDGKIDVLYDDLSLGMRPSSITYLNSWENENQVFLSMVVDKNTIVTGSFTSKGAWVRRSVYIQTDPITDFSVDQGHEFPFAVWRTDALKATTVAIYQSSDNNKTAWIEVDRMNYVKRPRLAVYPALKPNGDKVNYTYIGTVHETLDFFQLYRTFQINTGMVGPLISEWNEVYDITADELGHVLYVRADYNRQLSFAGLNSFQKWEQIQRNNPPSILINPQSSIESFFINREHVLVGFRTSNGALYLLSGIG